MVYYQSPQNIWVVLSPIYPKQPGALFSGRSVSIDNHQISCKPSTGRVPPDVWIEKLVPKTDCHTDIPRKNANKIMKRHEIKNTGFLENVATCKKAKLFRFE